MKIEDAIQKAWNKLTPKERKNIKEIVLWDFPILSGMYGIAGVMTQLPTPINALLLYPELELFYIGMHPEIYKKKLKKFIDLIEEYTGKPIKQVRSELTKKYGQILKEIKAKFTEKIKKVV